MIPRATFAAMLEPDAPSARDAPERAGESVSPDVQASPTSPTLVSCMLSPTSQPHLNRISPDPILTASLPVRSGRGRKLQRRSSVSHRSYPNFDPDPDPDPDVTLELASLTPDDSFPSEEIANAGSSSPSTEVLSNPFRPLGPHILPPTANCSSTRLGLRRLNSRTQMLRRSRNAFPLSRRCSHTSLSIT